MQNDHRPKQRTAWFQMSAGIDEYHRGCKVVERHGLEDAGRRVPAFAVSCLHTCDGQGDKGHSGDAPRNQTSRCVKRRAQERRNRRVRYEKQGYAGNPFYYCCDDE